ncbi:MAG: hypothetical protein ACLUGG_06165 [Oscillospiraceae bacterium]
MKNLQFFQRNRGFCRMLANSAQGGKVCTSFPKGRQNMAILFPTAAKKAVLQSNHHKPQG